MLQALTSQLKDIWSFLKNPQDKADTNLSTASKLQSLGLTLVIYVTLASALGVAVMGIEKMDWVNLDDHAVSNLMKSMPFWAYLFFIIIAGPFFEEVVFRYGLRFSRKWFAVFVSLVLLVIGGVAFQFLPLAGAIIVAVILVAILVFYYRKEQAVINHLSQAWPKFYGALFYLVAIVFGLVHMSNFVDSNFASAAVLLIPILVAPQILGGLLIGYLRVKYDFSWGFYLHAGNNAFFALASILFIGDLNEKLNTANENYTLKVEEWMPYSEHDMLAISSGLDSMHYVNVNLENLIADLLQKDKALLKFESAKHRHTFVNLRYVNKTAIKDIGANKKQVLEELKKLYKFDVLANSQDMDAWSLVIEDSTKLAAHKRVTQPDPGNTSTVKHEENSIILQNVTLDHLMQTLTAEHEIKPISDRELLAQSEGRYDFTIASKDAEKLKVELASQYGIKLKSGTEQGEVSVIKYR